MPSCGVRTWATAALLLVVTGCGSKQSAGETKPAPSEPAKADRPEPEAPAEPAVGFDLRVGYGGACVIADDGAWCWGDNSSGQLGKGIGEPCGSDDTVCVHAPTKIDAFESAVELALGNSHTCLLDADGKVSCLGQHATGQLGLGNTVTTVCSRGGYESPDCALDLDSGEIRCSGTRTVETVLLSCALTPTEVPGLAPVDEVWAGGSTCVKTKAGELWCAGSNGLRGVVELPERCGKYEDACVRTFAKASASDVTFVDFGTYGPCLLSSSGSVQCTGGHVSALKGIDDAIDLSVGHQHACAVRSDHTVTCAGWNAYGQLGLGTIDEPAAPARVAPKVFENATMVAAGSDFNCALDKDGEVSCWGANKAGQLGRGDTEEQLRPGKVDGLPKVSVVAAGGDFACALAEGDTVWCWGANDRGQLGRGKASRETCKTDRIFNPDVPCGPKPVEVDLSAAR